MSATVGDLLAKLSLDSSGFSDGVKKSQDELKKLKSSMENLSLAGTQMTAIGKAISIGITAPLVAAGTAIAKFTIDAAPMVNVQKAFEGVSESAGVMGDEMLTALQKGSHGMISNIDLMKSFNTAAALVGTDFAKKLPEAFEYLGKVSASTGQDMSYMLDSLVRGVGRLSPMIIDNLGIQVSLTEANEKYASSIGKSVDKLTKAEQQTALMNQVMEKLALNTSSMPSNVGSTSEAIAIMKATFKNAKDEIGTGFLPILQDIVENFTGFIDKIKLVVSEGGALYPVLQGWGEGLAGIIETITGFIVKLSEMDSAWLTTIANIAGFLAALGPVLLITGKVTTGLSKAIPAIVSFATSMAGAGVSVGAALAPITALVGILAGVGIAIAHHKSKVDELARSYGDLRNKAVKSGQSYDEYAKSVGDVGHTVEETNFSLVAHQATMKDLKRVLNDLHDAQVITEDEYVNFMYGLEYGTKSVNEVSEAVYNFAKRENDLTYAVDQTAESMIEHYIAISKTQQGMKEFEEQVIATEEELQRLLEIQQELADAKSLSTNFQGMVGYAKQWDDTQGQLNDKLAQIAVIDVNGDGIADIGNKAQATQEDLDALNGEVKDLQQAMTDMANQVVLDMLMATISVGGITETEAKAYFKLADDMGIISKEASEAAMTAYGDAINFVNGLEIDDKTGNILVDTTEWDLEYKRIQLEEFDTKIAKVIASLENESDIETALNNLARDRNFVMHGTYDIPQAMAEGGLVEGKNPYIVGERGPELFVPRVDGEIIPHSRLRDFTEPYGMTNPVSNTYNYNLTMPTTANAGDVAMAFELIQSIGV